MNLFQKLFQFSWYKINDLRTMFWSIVFGSFGKKSRVFGRIIVYTPHNIVLGDRSTLNAGCILNAHALLNIGNDVHISSGVIINTGGLDYSKLKKDRAHFKSKVIIEDGVWIGSGAIINPGVKIGENSVVGAGAVVTKDVPSNVVVVGVPARVIKKLVV